MKTLSPDLIASHRRQFPHIDNGYTYLNHSAVGPLSIPVRKAINDFLMVRSMGPIENFEDWMTIVQQCRQRIRDFIHANDEHQIAFTTNTSDGISLVAEGVEWHQGDEIILNDMEFPANVHPFRRLEKRGVNLVYIKSVDNKINPDQIEDAITSRTRMVSISAVQYVSGFKADLPSIGQICNKHNILFVVDGIQALGVVPIDVQKAHIDALATGGHKWLLAPMGAGFVYLSDNMLNKIEHFKAGWFSVENPLDVKKFDQNWKNNATKFETGTLNMSGIIGLNASLANLLALGTENIQNHISGLTSYMIDRIMTLENCYLCSPEEPNQRAGIITFSVPNNSEAGDLVTKLKNEKIIMSTRDGMIRVAPHYYNTTDEIDYFFSRLKNLL